MSHVLILREIIGDISAPNKPIYNATNNSYTQEITSYPSQLKMVLLDQLWDDVVAGPQPERGLEQLKKPFIKPTLTLKDVGEEASKNYGSSSMLTSPGTPGSPSTAKNDVWRSVFNPGSNLSTRNIGSDYYDKPTQPNSPTVYDWLYSSGSRSQRR